MSFDARGSQDGGGSHLSPSEGGGVYETKYQKSLRHYLTNEALPSEAHYRNLSSIVDGSSRPTMDELLSDSYTNEKKDATDAAAEGDKKGVIKFGWLEGVFMRCLLNIWGVMLFLRVSWVVGEAGVVYAIVIVIMGNIVTTITTLSMSAVATNGRIKAGGVYYMISRSLGPEFGGSIGLMFTIANSIAAATYVIGFCDSLKDMLKYDFDGAVVIDGGTNDTRVVGTVTLIAVLALAIVGMDWVTRVQMGLLVVLIASQVDFVVGIFMGPQSDEERAMGFVGLNGDLLKKNTWTDYRVDEGKEYNLFKVFAVFFTAVTGIVAGANLSGDLKDPGTAIPKGTLAAIGLTFSTYIIYPIMLGASIVRDASGNVEVYRNSSIAGDKILDNKAFSNESCFFGGEGLATGDVDTCEFGLENSFQVMELASAWGPLIYIGCFAATLSSAIASLVGAPRVLQALARDRLFPGIHIFEKGYGANNDPVRGYILVFIISFACIMVGDLNVISTLLSNFFLASYCLINVSCFHASFIKSPGWRPSFKYYNKWVSLLGGLLCLVVMFFIDWITALITFVITIALYMFVSYRKPDVNWGSSTQGQTYVSALKSTLDLATVEDHVKNYRPQILVMSGSPGTRPPLIDFANLITKNISLLICGHVLKGEHTQKVRNTISKQSYNWLTKHKIRAFYSVVEANSLDLGARSLFQASGLGKLRPNMVLMGYKHNWTKCKREEIKAYFNTLHEALEMYYGIAILRVPNGLDYSRQLEDSDTPILESEGIIVNEQDQEPVDSLVPDIAEGASSEITSAPKVEQVQEEKKSKNDVLYHGPGGADLPKDILDNITLFQKKQKNGTIDVWWLYDDGGLTLLLPYILTTRSQWGSCKLRVFALANRKQELDMEQRSMANLLAKFRIDFTDMIVIPEAAKKATDTSKNEFDALIEDFRAANDIDAKNNEGLVITDAELLAQKEKTNRHLRLRELLLQNSMESSLVVMTLPMPRKTTVSPPLYMSWLETLTKGMPPFLLIRGNQTSVLTFYS